MHDVHIVDEQGSYLLIERGGRFAVLERRNGHLYNLHCGARAPDALTDEGAEHAVGNHWCDEIEARRLFHDVTAQYRELAEHMW